MWIRRYQAADAFQAFEFINYLWPSCEWLWKQLSASDILIFSFRSSPSCSAKRIFIMNDVATVKWKEIWINNWSFIVEFHTVKQHSSICSVSLRQNSRLTTASLEKFQQRWASQLEFRLSLELWWRERILKSVRNHGVRREAYKLSITGFSVYLIY